jgi:hypothetical protein
MIRRSLTIALLALGTVAGYGSALCSWSHHRHARHAAFEQHVARVCVDAARRAPPPPR